MRVRLLLAAVCIFTLPIFLSPSTGDKPINSAPFATVAMAGHVIPSLRYCACGSSPECICDPGEKSIQAASGQTTTDTATLDNEVSNGIDPGAALMLVTLALLFGLRLRF